MSAQGKENKEQHQFVDAIGFLCQKKRTGGLLVRAESRQGEVFLQEGRIIHAHYGPLVGVKALLSMLKWERGTYNFTPQQTTDQTSIETQTAEILSLLAHHAKEWKRIHQDQTLHLDTVLRLLPQESGTVNLTKEEWDILTRIDGKKSFEEIANELDLLPLDLAKSVQRFFKAGLIGAGPPSAEQAGALFGADYLAALEKELRLAVGPVASIILEEGLKDLHPAGESLTAQKIETLLERLSKAIPEQEKRAGFQKTARGLTTEFSNKEIPPHKEEQEETK